MLKNSIVSPSKHKFDMTDVLSEEDFYDSFKESNKIKEMFIKTSLGNVHAFYAGEQNKCTILAMHGDGTGRNHEKWLSVTELFAD